MKRSPDKKKSPIPFILLNILISAATILIVLWIWTSLHPEYTMQNNIEMNPDLLLQTETIGVEKTPPPLPSEDDPGIEIINVFGAGDIDNEVVILKRNQAGEIWLTGWKLVDQNGNEYSFPEMRINQNASLQLFSKAGFDSVTELYWGKDQSVFTANETISIIDHQGNVRFTFSVQ